MSEKPVALRLADDLTTKADAMKSLMEAAQILRIQHARNMDLLDDNERLTADNERLTADNERLRDELRQSSIDHTRAEVERLTADNERLREALAWAYNLRHLRGYSDPVVIPERFAPFIEAALRREETT